MSGDRLPAWLDLRPGPKAAVAAVLSLVGLWVMLRWFDPHGYNDLDVYRLGGQTLLDGVDPYDPGFNGGDLQFTYPPIATLLFVPFALVPVEVARLALIAISVACLAGVVTLALRACLPGRTVPVTSFAVAALTGFALLVEPVRETLTFGQVNLILTFLVMVDVLVLGRRGSRWRGTLVGLCAAVKLTPAIFVLWFLVRRDWRGTVGVVAGFVAGSLVGLVARPGPTFDYWTSALHDTERIGLSDLAANQSIAGVLARLGDGEPDRLAWVLLCAPVVAAATFVAWRLTLRGQDLVALLAIALAGLLVSPITWTHHWVWTVPAIIATALLWRSRHALLAAGAFYAFMVIGVPWRVPHRDGKEQYWDPFQAVLGNSYVWIGFLVLAAAFVLAVRDARSSADEPDDDAAPPVEVPAR